MGDIEGLPARVLNQGIPRLLDARIQEGYKLKLSAEKVYDRLIELHHKEGVPELAASIRAIDAAIQEAKRAIDLLDPFAAGGITDASRDNAATALRNLEHAIKSLNAHGVRNAA